MAQEMQQQLLTAAAAVDQKQRVEMYRAALPLLAQGVDQCKGFIDHMLSNDVPLVISRQLLVAFAQEIAKLPADLHKAAAIYAIEKLAGRVVSFEDSVTLVRESLAGVWEREEEWSKAAQVLAGIDLDSSTRSLDAHYKLRQNVKIAMLYLEDDDSVNAEMYIKKAGASISACRDEGLELQYKVCYARILDAKRRFIEAAARYYDLSQARTSVMSGGAAGAASTSTSGATQVAVDEEELETALRAAITCTILAAAGPQRSRMLATLYKDERSARTPLYPFLEKVYLERILTQAEVEGFAKTLKPHQVATLPDGSTVLDRAVMQHNLLSASKLYDNIGCEQLGTLLGVPVERAESVAADMIAEGRMRGSIDQVERLIHFDAGVEMLLQWDEQVAGVCHQVEDILEHASATNAGILA